MYLDYQFRGCDRADDWFQNFKLALNVRSPSGVNGWSKGKREVFLKSFCKTEHRMIHIQNIAKLIFTGYCLLHVVHGVLNYGAIATDWKRDSLLRSMWYTFS